MLLTEEEFKSTFPKDGFVNVTQSAQNFNEKEFVNMCAITWLKNWEKCI